jgi:ferric-dicitrate binding protein FerR (iron transport regulator)
MKGTNAQDSTHIADLISGYLLNDLNQAELFELESWLNVSDENREIFRSILNESALEHQGLIYTSVNTSSALINAKRNLEFSTSREPGKSRIWKLWQYIAVASVVLIALSAVILFYPNIKPEIKDLASLYPNDVAPGRNTATLTLADGRKVVLSDAVNGTLAEQAGVSISKAANGQLVYTVKDAGALEELKYNTLSTANGEQYQLRLPDNSVVWLNAASSLTYTASLNEHGQRRVKLKGEAYFEIAKDKDHPFIVETAGQEIVVLGTHFNVNSYADEGESKTTLLEGSVSIRSSKEHKLLKPGQQALFSRNQLQISTADIEESLAWKNGLFMFNDKKLEDIMKMVSRWYNVEVTYNGDSAKNELFSGTVSRFNNVSELLKVLESSGLVHFKIEGRKILINP